MVRTKPDIKTWETKMVAESRVDWVWPVWLAFISILAVLGSSCVPEAKQVSSSTLASIRAETGARLDNNTIVIAESGSTRSDTYEWTIFSPERGSIALPLAIGGGYLTNELRIAIEVLEEKAKKKIADAESTFTSVWNKGKHQYRGIVIQTTNGDYLYLVRF